MEEQTKQEQWRPIDGTAGRYEVSDHGRVRSLARGKVRIMPTTRQHHGYHAFMIWIDGKAQCRKVHREVALAFIGNPNHLPEVNHIDGNKDNNHVSNLEWVTHQRNVKHSFDTGLKHPHRWTKEERQRISQSLKAYHIWRICTYGRTKPDPKPDPPTSPKPPGLI